MPRSSLTIENADPNNANNAVRDAAHRELDLVLDLAARPNYTGQIGVTVSSKDGRLGHPKIETVKYARV